MMVCEDGEVMVVSLFLYLLKVYEFVTVVACYLAENCEYTFLVKF